MIPKYPYFGTFFDSRSDHPSESPEHQFTQGVTANTRQLIHVTANKAGDQPQAPTQSTIQKHVEPKRPSHAKWNSPNYFQYE